MWGCHHSDKRQTCKDYFVNRNKGYATTMYVILMEKFLLCLSTTLFTASWNFICNSFYAGFITFLSCHITVCRRRDLCFQILKIGLEKGTILCFCFLLMNIYDINCDVNNWHCTAVWECVHWKICSNQSVVALWWLWLLIIWQIDRSKRDRLCDITASVSLLLEFPHRFCSDLWKHVRRTP